MRPPLSPRMCAPRREKETKKAFRILLATNGSESALKAARYLARILPESGAELTLLCVIVPVCDSKDLAGLPVIEISREMVARMEERSPQTVFEKTLDALGNNRPRLFCEISQGRPASAICRAVEEGQFDLVVLGSGGKRRFGRTLAETVRRQSSCPVLVIP
ncbi:MAG: universal stress protein [Armatimonadetes bacterium]|nr:universal stress protein [Armatimonadota bacterium]